ncbi:hypothetical protein ABZS76_33290 [Streptomyces sp. NPDC005562]|uniref:hypothetical protein n=1 Tax=Streptomyces sp. NPDC005562 TaxID=3154890 RepID=UPI0033A3BCA7
MARAHVMRPITGENGDLLYGAQVLVREAGLSVKLAQPLYAGPNGDEQLSNPHVAASGVIDFWLEDAQRVSVLIQSEQHSDILVYLDAAPPPEETARTDSPLLITGSQVPGHVLLAGDKPGEAVWGPAPTNSGLTPQVTVISEAFARGQDPAGWSFTQAASSTRDYSTSVPEDQGLLRSLHAAHTGNAGRFTVTSPGFTLIEAGAVSMWLRPSLAADESVIVSVTAQGGGTTILQTFTETRDWGFYRFPLAAGTYQSVSVEFVGAATFVGSTGHEVWVTSIKAIYGGRVPTHDHPGSGAGSVQLGAGSEASGIGSIGIGSGARGSGANSTAVGYQSQATGVDSLAVGSGAQAVADNTIAVGPRAKGSLASAGWTAIGPDAYADAANGTAVGARAKSDAPGGTAIGRDAYVSTEATDSTAIGAGAQVLGANSVALGNGAVVGTSHSGSAAIGAGATTSAVGQIMLGQPTALYRAVIIGNKLIAVSAVNLGSDATSRLGFYGSEGTTKPVVTGADGGVVALRNLLGALAGLGLITNNTTP